MEWPATSIAGGRPAINIGLISKALEDIVAESNEKTPFSSTHSFDASLLKTPVNICTNLILPETSIPSGAK